MANTTCNVCQVSADPAGTGWPTYGAMIKDLRQQGWTMDDIQVCEDCAAPIREWRGANVSKPKGKPVLVADVRPRPPIVLRKRSPGRRSAVVRA